MLLKQMGSISIPLPLSPATKLLTDHAKLTVSYSRDRLMVISTGSAGSSGGIFLSGKENWNNSVPGCKCLERSSPCTGTSKLTLCCFALVLWAEAALSLSVFIHSEHWPWLCSCWVTRVFCQLCLPFWSSLAQELLFVLNVASSHTTQKNGQTDQNACEYTLTGEMGHIWKWDQDCW